MISADAFEEYAPLNEALPPDFPHGFFFNLVAVRARALLKNRLDQDVRNALDSLICMLEDGAKLEFEESVKAVDNDDYVSTQANALRLYMDDFDISDQKLFANATWPEYFAVLSLAHIGMASQLQNKIDKIADEDTMDVVDDYLISTGGQNTIDYLLEAFEAATAGQFLYDSENKVRKSRSQGGKIKAKKYEPLKIFVITRWRECYQDHSNRHAASRIWDETPEDLKRLIRTDEPVKRLEIWIGQEKRRKK
ncbi:MAG: hypothetical protein N0E58_03760 [Candidatus Thiodiazotropha endolucinida]|uniref:Uncharacterized protein n=1 Tax=Candidatus Thiodiazotropha taylori TaxID=2792791 RepID=A0A9E4TS28_9GAMM|nr:hypothetical protein [Candidatus Thiodiazotropha taylori]MCW4235369.1 hypothetical protein [Candidatus Thiodiazotropha endolucinida]